MSPRDWEERIRDMLACAGNAQSFAAGLTLPAFLDDPKALRAVAFELMTMGEAARSIPHEVQERYPQVPWAKMLGIRNVLIHEYFRLDGEILWNAVQNDLPSLISALEEILDRSQ